MIGVVDYGAGNLLSVRKALDYLGVESMFIRSPMEFSGLNGLILPGVGAFGAAIEELQSRGIYESIKDWLLADKPFLGICLGMQVLFERSEESEGVEGFGLFEGDVLRFKGHKVPQIGWNQVRVVRESRIMQGIEDGAFFYFLHGYFAAPRDEDIVVGITEYGVLYPSVIEVGNVSAVQFHPEKSGVVGLQLLRNWVEHVGREDNTLS